MNGLGTVESAMVNRAAHNQQVITLAEDAGVTPAELAETVVRAIFARAGGARA